MSSESGCKHSSDRTDSLKGGLEGIRVANVERIVGSAVAKLPVDVFLKHVLPPLHQSFTPAKVGKILAGLKVKHRGLKSAPYSPSEQRWTAFDEVEKVTYQALVTISNQITAEVQAVLKGKTPKQLFDFVNEGNAAPVSVVRDSTSKPDAYFVLRDRQAKGKKVHLMDIGPTGEYKFDNSEIVIRNNLEGILWNMMHTMREDARRRFTFAFTVEDTNMRLWYSSRADILVSHNFDFMEEPETLLRFFLAFLYATEADAGWDPTMECVWDGLIPQYIITVHDAAKKKHKYKTVEMLSDIGAGSLRGRGTRVWKVVPFGKSPANTAGGSKKAELVLKDCWVDKGAGKEGDIITAILADAQKKVDEWEKIRALHENDRQKLDGFPEEVKFTKDDLEELTKSLLLPSMHSEVLLGNVVTEPDKTLDRANLWTGDEIPYHRLWDSATQYDAKSEPKQSTLYLYHRGRDEPIMYKEKVHYRVVFEDVCLAIKDEKFLHRAYMFLAMACKALELLHKTGWVHRDISIGNILVTPEDKVKLADFEYAKRTTFEDAAGHDICTGTLAFMAVEVQQTSYLFLPPKLGGPKPPREPDFRFKKDKVQEGGKLPRKFDEASLAGLGTGIPWRYNPIHDLESVMWLGNYFTIGRSIEFQPTSTTALDAEILFDEDAIVSEPQEKRVRRIISQDNYASNLFYQTNYRQKALLSMEGWGDLVHPAIVKADILLLLNDVRARLVTRYMEVENNVTVSRQVLAGRSLYQDIAVDFADACEQMERFSHLAVMRDLARETAGLQEKLAVPVAQLQKMSLQDGVSPRTDAGRNAEVAGPSQQQTQLVDLLGSINPTSPGHPQDTNQAHPPADSPKTVKPTKKLRQRATPAVPTRIQPPREARSRG